MRKPAKYFYWGAILLCLLLAMVLLLFVNPSETPLFPKCVFRQLTGWYCPGCGSGRGMYQLLRGNILLAWQLNPALIIGLLLLLLMFLSDLFSSRSPFFHRLQRFFFSSLFAYLLLASILLWWILRNIL